MLLSPFANSGQSTDYDVAAAFDRCFPRINTWGFPPETTGRLLSDPGLGPAIYEDLRADFTGRSRRPGRAAWQFQLKNRARFHLGGSAWQVCFGAWPILPVLDRSLHEVVGGMPLASLVERRLATEVVRAHLPRLARIPLDRYSRPPFPIEPSSTDLLREALSRRLNRILKLGSRLRAGHDPRHYHRNANINAPGWRAIRREAEASRGLADRFLDRSVLDQMLPGPGVTIPVTDEVRDSAKFKLLVGFLLWLGCRNGVGGAEPAGG
jgi:asparagine synthase (glutamine-hydrolysing)